MINVRNPLVMLAIFSLSLIAVSSQSFAGVISGATVLLDARTPTSGVIIRARRVDSNGRPTDEFVGGTERSGLNGVFSIDVGDTPLVQLEFVRGVQTMTTLEKIVGTNSLSGLVVAVPEQRPCTTHQRRRCLMRCLRR